MSNRAILNNVNQMAHHEAGYGSPQKSQNLDAKVEDKSKRLIRSTRLWIILLALIGSSITSYSKAIINFAIIDMVVPSTSINHNHHNHNTNDSSSRSSNNDNYNIEFDIKIQDSNLTELETNANTEPPIFREKANFELDNSCPVSEFDRQRLLNEQNVNVSRKLSSGEKFDWDSDKQGYLKGAFAIGHAPLQIMGGRMSEIYGPRWVLTLGGLAMGLSCLLAPISAKCSFYLIFIDLVLLGLFVSMITPSLFTLFARWLTPGEKSMLASFNLVASRGGYALSYLICAYLIEMGYTWRDVFLSAGVVAITWSFVVVLVVRDWPHDHFWITDGERDYLATKNKAVQDDLWLRSVQLKLVDQIDEPKAKKLAADAKRPVRAAPWTAILTSLPVWAFIVTKFCVKLSGDTVAIELPTYLHKVMHFPATKNGQINTLGNVMFSITSLVLGVVVKVTTKWRPFNLSKTAMRKIFQSIASFGVALGLLAMSMSVCDHFVTEMALFYIMFITTFGAGGEVQLALDMTSHYTGTLHSIASSLAISGFIAPTFIGIFMKGHSSDRNNWSSVWMAASIVAAFGGIVFVLFADAEIQPFDSINIDQNGPHKSANGQPQVQMNETKLSMATNGTLKEQEKKKKENEKSDSELQSAVIRL